MEREDGEIEMGDETNTMIVDSKDFPTDNSSMATEETDTKVTIVSKVLNAITLLC